jgi:hypothetical protein
MLLLAGWALMVGKTRQATSQEVRDILCIYDNIVPNLQTGLFAGTVGVRRLLKLFEKYDIKTTWFIPGHSLETFPEECAMIRDAGHEM